jgi:uncharacterized membrane protein YdcZ (DUF606 family)
MLREVELKQKRQLYHLCKTLLMVGGGVLVIYGCYFALSQYVAKNSLFWFAICPGYVGSMMILISLAMKLEWFTNARRFW